MKKNFSLMLTKKNKKYCFTKEVNGKYFTEHTIDGNRYIVSKRLYCVQGTREKTMKIKYRTKSRDSVYVLVDEHYVYVATFDCDMNLFFSNIKTARVLNEKVDRQMPYVWELVNTLRIVER